MEQKTDMAKLETLEHEKEELWNRLRRNNLVFYNVPEQAEGVDCVALFKIS